MTLFPLKNVEKENKRVAVDLQLIRWDRPSSIKTHDVGRGKEIEKGTAKPVIGSMKENNGNLR